MKLPPLPKWTVLPVGLKPEPVIVTRVPTGPEEGVREIMETVAAPVKAVVASMVMPPTITAVAIRRITLRALTNMAAPTGDTTRMFR